MKEFTPSSKTWLFDQLDRLEREQKDWPEWKKEDAKRMERLHNQEKAPIKDPQSSDGS